MSLRNTWNTRNRNHPSSRAARVFRGFTLLLPFVLGIAAAHAAKIETISIHSQKMDRPVNTKVIVPDSYAQGTNHYPVIYLLHGAGGCHLTWARQDIVAEQADRNDVIFVCPNAAPKSWYFDSPIDPNFQFETFVAEECVEYMDEHFRTKAERQYRALCGNSMGGHGALFLAARHQETFGTAVALSAGADIRPFPENWEIKLRIGSIEEYPENWKNLTVMNVIKQVSPDELAISLDCGVEDFFLQVNRRLHDQLIQDGIDHHYEENPGAHTWDYWRAALKRQMPFMMEQFRD